MLERWYFLDGHSAVGLVVEGGHDHAVGALANVLQVCVARTDLEHLASDYVAVIVAHSLLLILFIFLLYFNVVISDIVIKLLEIVSARDNYLCK